MSLTPASTADAASAALDPRVIKAFGRLSGAYWRGDQWRQAWLLTAALLACLVASLGATLALNRWHRWFFDALERKDAETMGVAVLVLGLIIAAMAAIGVGIVRSRETLQVRWRAWLTTRLLSGWLDEQHFYHMGIAHTAPANPEYRISDDVRWATELLVDFAIGLFSAVVGAAAFIGILWSVGGALTVTLGGSPLTIPAYMVLGAIAYGMVASGLMLYVGRPLVGSVVRKNEAEGHFRFAMMRVRDNAEAIAVGRSGSGERVRIGRLYDTLVQRWLAIVRQHGNLTWITNASGPLIPIVPLLLAGPKYLSGELSLGQVMQLAAAFVQVQIAISWIVDNYNRIAEWYASARRIMELVDACETAPPTGHVPGAAAAAGAPIVSRIAVATSRDATLVLEDLVVHDSASQPLSDPLSVVIRPGERVLITGESGTGKTSLVRALAGLSPRGAGTIHLPDGRWPMVVPQKPYLPAGTLRDALVYAGAEPAHGAARHPRVSDDGLQAALVRTGLGHLSARLDDVARWEDLLSNGEHQRLAFARVLVQRPAIVVLDEPATALDETTQRSLFGALHADIPDMMLLTLSQRRLATGLHERVIVLLRHPADRAGEKVRSGLAVVPA